MGKCKVSSSHLRQAVERRQQGGPHRHNDKIGKGRKEKTIHDNDRDWAYLLQAAGKKGVKDYEENDFFDTMEELATTVGYHRSRFDKYRSAVSNAHSKAVDKKLMTEKDCWTLSKNFSQKYGYIKKRAVTTYLKKKSEMAKVKGAKKYEEDGDPDDGLRGAITEDKGIQLVRHLSEKGLSAYAQGVVIAHGGLIRHGELVKMQHQHFYQEGGQWHVKVIGGKFRSEDHVDHVFLHKCEKAIANVVKKGDFGLLFPDWDPEVIRHEIKQCAKDNGWDTNKKWDFHCLRHGKAVDNRVLWKLPLNVRMERGRWKDEKVERHYSRYR